MTRPSRTGPRGQRATFTVELPGRTPGQVRASTRRQRLGSTTGAESSARRSGHGHAYPRSPVQNPKCCAPRQTQAEDRDDGEAQCLLVPIPCGAGRPSATRPARAAAGRSGTSVLVPRGGRGGRGDAAAAVGGGREVSIGRGSRQTLYVLGETARGPPVQVVGARANGSLTEVNGRPARGQKCHRAPRPRPDRRKSERKRGRRTARRGRAMARAIRRHPRDASPGLSRRRVSPADADTGLAGPPPQVSRPRVGRQGGAAAYAAGRPRLREDAEQRRAFLDSREARAAAQRRERRGDARPRRRSGAAGE